MDAESRRPGEPGRGHVLWASWEEGNPHSVTCCRARVSLAWSGTTSGPSPAHRDRAPFHGTFFAQLSVGETVLSHYLDSDLAPSRSRRDASSVHVPRVPSPARGPVETPPGSRRYGRSRDDQPRASHSTRVKSHLWDELPARALLCREMPDALRLSLLRVPSRRSGAAAPPLAVWGVSC